VERPAVAGGSAEVSVRTTHRRPVHHTKGTGTVGTRVVPTRFDRASLPAEAGGRAALSVSSWFWSPAPALGRWHSYSYGVLSALHAVLSERGGQADSQ
jgi:hypothetical protein